MSKFYDKAHKEMTVNEWGAKMEDWDYKRVAKDIIDDTEISTVWLGMDHSFGDGPPIIFETMIFGGEHDDFCERYVTEEEALDGHVRAIALVHGWEETQNGTSSKVSK